MTEAKANALVDALLEEFGGAVEVEMVSPDGRYRFSIDSPRFEGIEQLQRQDLAWKVVDRTLAREETLDVSLVLTYAPSDFEPVAEESH